MAVYPGDNFGFKENGFSTELYRPKLVRLARSQFPAVSLIKVDQIFALSSQKDPDAATLKLAMGSLTSFEQAELAARVLLAQQKGEQLETWFLESIMGFETRWCWNTNIFREAYKVNVRRDAANDLAKRQALLEKGSKYLAGASQGSTPADIPKLVAAVATLGAVSSTCSSCSPVQKRNLQKELTTAEIRLAAAKPTVRNLERVSFIAGSSSTPIGLRKAAADVAVKASTPRLDPDTQTRLLSSAVKNLKDVIDAPKADKELVVQATRSRDFAVTLASQRNLQIQ